MSSGITWQTASFSFSGDTVNCPGGFQQILTGSEGAWTSTLIVGGSGTLSGGVQRVCIATDDVNLSAIKTAVEVLDNAISGSEMQVDVVGALPAGTNNIGDVDVLSVIPGTGATNLGKAIDAVLGATDTGVLALTVRDDVLATLTEADGDVSALRVDSTGRLWCNVSNTVATTLTSTTITGTVAVTQSGTWDEVGINDSGNSITVDNGGTFVVQENGAALTALQLIDDAVQTEDAAHSTGHKGIFALAVRSDTAASTAGTDGDYTGLITDSTGKLHVNVGNTITSTVSGTVAVTQSGTWNITNVSGTVSLPTGASTLAEQQSQTTHLGTLAGTDFMLGTDFSAVLGTASLIIATQADNTANTQDTIATSALGYAFDGTTWDRMRGDATDGLLVNLGTNNDVTLATLPDTAAGDLAAIRSSVGGTLTVGTHAVTQSGTWNIGTVTTLTGTTTLTPGTGATNLGKAVDTAAGATDTGVATLAVRDDALSALTPVEGDYVQLRTDANGALWVIPSGTVTVAGAVTNGGTFVVQENGAALTALQLIDNVVHVDDAAFTLGTSSGVMIMGFAGTQSVNANDAAALACETDGSLHIHDGGNTITVDGTVTVNLAAGTNTNEVVGDAAHDAAVAGNPVRIGARAESALSGITLVADGDTTDVYAGLDGVLIVRTHSNLEDVVAERVTNTDGASTAFASGLAAPGAGIRICLTKLTICNSSATFCTVDIRDGAAGSVLWTVPVPATGGVTEKFDPPLKFTANTAVAYDASAATSTLTISGLGFKTKL